MTERVSNESTTTGVPPAEMMLQLISGFWISRAIYVAAKLGIADLVKDGPQPVAALAEATGTHAPSLYRVLRALAGVGVFVENQDGRFASTPPAATLQTDAPGSLRAFAMVELGEEHYPAWGALLHSVKTGAIAFDHVFGMNVWQCYAQNPENARTFDDAMSSMTNVINAAIIAAYDFSSIGTVVDVAGGHGNLIASILKANPAMRGILLDVPHVIEGARHRIEAEGLADRCELVAGDFFESVPGGGDAYVLKWIIHDWDDERSVAILKNCRRAMAENGRLLIIEAVIPPGNEPSFGKFMDLNMLVMTGGRERTEAEFGDLLAAAGFKLTRIVPTQSAMCLIEGARA